MQGLLGGVAERIVLPVGDDEAGETDDGENRQSEQNEAQGLEAATHGGHRRCLQGSAKWWCRPIYHADCVIGVLRKTSVCARCISTSRSKKIANRCSERA